MLRFLLAALLVGLVVVGFLGARPASAPPPEATASAATPSTAEDVRLTPFEHDGLRGQMPVGWDEEAPGTFVSPARDATFVVQSLPPVPLALVVPVVMRNIGVDATPDAHGQRSANGVQWTLYSTTADGKPVDFALGAGAGGNLLLLLQSPVGQRDAFYDAVFLPLVDALTPA